MPQRAIDCGVGLVEQRLPKLCAGLAAQDASPPAFVTREFRNYLRCGMLEYRFIRVAAVARQPHERSRLEHLCRYMMRPAICLERLSINSSGQVVYRLEQPFRDGTTHVLLSPEEFIARLVDRFHINVAI